MRRGEIRWVDLDPVLGSATNKRRPAVIVSNDGANATANRLGRGVVTMVPVTTNVARIYPFQVALSSRQTGLQRDSKAQAEQVRSVAVERIGALMGVLSSDDIAALDEALRLHLASNSASQMRPGPRRTTDGHLGPPSFGWGDSRPASTESLALTLDGQSSFGRRS